MVLRGEKSNVRRALALLLAAVCFLHSFFIAIPVRAEDALPPKLTVTLYSGDAMPSGDAETDSAMLFTTYLSQHRNPEDEITLAMNAQQPFEVSENAVQLGTEANPFKGKVYFNAISEASFVAAKALFAWISTDAGFYSGDSSPFTGSITIVRSTTDSDEIRNSALFADHVTAGESVDTLAVSICCESDGENNVTYAGVIGEIDSGAKVDLTYTNNGTAGGSESNVYSQGNVGLACGTMKDGSELTLTLSGSFTAYTVTSDSGAAGGLVGVMMDGARLILNNDYADTVTVTAAGGTYTPPANPVYAPASVPALPQSASAASAAPAADTGREPEPEDTLPGQETPAEEPVSEPAEEPVEEETPIEESAAQDESVMLPIGDMIPVEPPVKDEMLSVIPGADAVNGGDFDAEEPVADETPVEETPVEEPAVIETPAEEPVIEETPSGEPVVEETPVEETPIEETPAEETPVEGPAAEEPPLEEPVIEETPAEETPVEEPAAEEIPADTEPAGEKSADESAPVEGPAALLRGAVLMAAAQGTRPEIDTASLKSGCAGGIVGWAENAVIELAPGITVTVAGTVAGSRAAGGVYGVYLASADQTFELDSYTVTASIGSGSYTSAGVGGVFGTLTGTADVTVTDAAFAPTAANKNKYNIAPVFVHGAFAGGLIGFYENDDLANTLLVEDVKTHVSSFGSAGRRGGIIGKMGTTPAYVELRRVGAWVVDALGGLVGSMGDGGSSFVNVCEYAGLRGTANGGLVGYVNNGVLRLQGVTQMQDNAVMGGGMSASAGQLVYSHGNGLIYAVGTGADTSIDNAGGTGWALYRVNANRVGDVYDWGEAVRFDGTHLTLGSVLTEDLTGHSVTVLPAVTAMSSADDFARTALNIQHNTGEIPSGGALRFAGGTGSSALLGGSLSMTADISLSGTGLTGLTRDNGANDSFTGTFSGGGNTLTLAVGEVYGLEYNGAAASETVSRGAGRIYEHRYDGLFARVTGAEISDLTVDGTVSVMPSGTDTAAYCIGGIAGYSDGDLTLDTCSVSPAMDVFVTTDKGVYVGGAVGLVEDAAAAINITDGTYAAEINDRRTVSAGSVYFGGAVGCVNAGDVRGQIDFTVSGVTIDGSFSNASASSTTSTRYGGLIGQIKPFNNGEVLRTVTITDASVAGLDIASASNYAAGGLLGYQWMCTDVTIGDSSNAHGLTIGDSGDASASPTVSFTPTTSGTMMGALVYSASGHWVVNHVDVEQASFSTGAATVDFGFVAASGISTWTSGNRSYYAALYLDVTGTAASGYDLSGISVGGSGFNVFDEVVAHSHAYNKAITDNDAAVISLRTADGGPVKMDGADCNTYQNQTAYGKAEPSKSLHDKSRYYYNLDLIRAKADGSKTNGEKLLMWSLYRYSHSTIRSYFPKTISGAVSGVYDMTGISYYPVTASGITLRNATVKFYNEQFEIGENLSGGDGLVRSSRAATQHELLHSGILYDASNIKVTNLTVQGTVGAMTDSGMEGSGFLVRGTLFDSTGKVSEITGVTLDGAAVRIGSTTPDGTVTDSDYAPLLINKAGSTANDKPTNLTVSTVTTANYAADEAAASSLIGRVNGNSIQMTFTDMRLDARTGTDSVDAALTTAYGTTRSIFTRATLLESFTHVDSNSEGRYNFNLDEDWDGSAPKHHVTYGKEITGSAEYPGIQSEYFDQEVRTNPTTSSGASYNFNTAAWLPYVKTGFNSSANTHELRVNQKLTSFNEGCGKYDDPYNITDGGQLVSVAQIIKGEDVDSSFEIVLPDSLTPNTAHTGSGAGSQANDEAYHFNGTSFVNEGGTKSYTKAQVREYLAGAYYCIAGNSSGEITIPEGTFTGLGVVTDIDVSNYETKYAFRGVIYGANPSVKIINETASPLIANSNGAVVKDLRITATKAFTVTRNNESNNANLTVKYEGGLENYGAVIGRVMGGDTFIDQVSVSYELTDSPSIGGSAMRLVPVGGYVGVIVNGGVVFRNMPDDAGDSFSSAYGAYMDDTWLYVNPIIGRVVAGYAFSEGDGCVVDNGNKNYEIPLLDPFETDMLDVTGSAVTVPNGQALWVLGAVINSGAGAATNNGAYPAGSSMGVWSGFRNYTAARVGIDAYGSYVYNDSNYANNSSKKPYIISQYTTGNARSVGKLTGLSVSITGDCTVPRGFRGIGCFYVDNADLRLTASSFGGGGHTVTFESMRYKEYDTQKTGENYKAVGADAGFGLVNALRQNTAFSDMTISGTIYYDIIRADTGAGLKYASRTGSGCVNADIVSSGSVTTALSVGGIIGYANGGSPTITNVNTDSLSLEGACFVGGLIGRTGSATTITTCASSDLTVRGGLQGGGLIGFAGTSGVITIDGGSGTAITDADIYSKAYRGDGTESSERVGAAGGLVAASLNAKLLISNYTVSGGRISAYYYAGQNQTNLAGGAVGLVRNCGSGSTISGFTLSDVMVEAAFAGGVVAENVQGNPLTVRSVAVTGSDTAYIRSQRCAGGVIASQHTRLSVDTCSVTDYSIYVIPGASNWDRNSAGGIMGFAFEGGSDLRNIRVDGCDIFTFNAGNGTDKDKRNGGAGGLVGRLNDGTMTGGNILVNDTRTTNYKNVSVSGDSVTKSSPLATNYGSLVAWKADDDYLKLVGVSVIDVTSAGTTAAAPVGTVTDRPFYGYGTDGYVVFADFGGSAAGATPNQTAPAFFGADDNDIAEPYVTVNPACSVGGNVLTGDGVADTAADLSINDIIADAGTRYDVSWNKTGIDTEFNLSTFKTEANITDPGVPDTAVLVLEASRTSQEITQLITSYIDHLTNTAYDYSIPAQIDGICDIEILRMEWDDGFALTSSQVSLLWDKINRRFSVAKNLVDNNRDSFTLIDVKYFDPADTSKIEYHLYVPVLVKKVLEFRFTSNVLPGTVYRQADYSGRKQLLENFGTPVTITFTYTYERTADDWAGSLRGGDSMLGNYDKSIILSKYDNVDALPAGTELALVDAQNGRAYYYTLPAGFTGELALSSFTAADGTTPFEPVSLSDRLDMTAAADNAGDFVRCASDHADALVQAADGCYYRLFVEDTDGAEQRYSISTAVNSLSETYYLSIFTDTEDTGIARYAVDCPKRLPGTYPTLCVSTEAQKRSDMILGRVYTITSSLETSGGDGENVLDRTNYVITAEMSANITLNQGSVYKDYVGSIYHSFLLHLTKSDEEGVVTAIKGDPTVSGTYSVDGGSSRSYMNGAASSWTASGGYAQFTVSDDISGSLKDPSKSYTARITATAEVNYHGNQTSIEEQFPGRPNDITADTFTGTTVFLKSNIASAPERAAYSSTSVRANDDSNNRYFSKGEVKEAILYYSVVSDDVGNEMAGLGINPLDSDVELSALVRTEGVLDFSNVADEAEECTHFKVVLTLGQRSDSYVGKLNFSSYLDSMTVGGQTVDFAQHDADTVELFIPKNDSGITLTGNQVAIPVDFNVKTGLALESGSLFYSNYRMTLDVDMVKITGEAEPEMLVNSASNFIIYTNAKVIPDFID